MTRMKMAASLPLIAALTLGVTMAAWANCGNPYLGAPTSSAHCNYDAQGHCTDGTNEVVSQGGCDALSNATCYRALGPVTLATADCSTFGNNCDMSSYTSEAWYGYAGSGTCAY